jgi:hypothetical protein
MVRKAAFVVLLVVLGGVLAGCGPCGFGFSISDMTQSCRGEPNPQR